MKNIEVEMLSDATNSPVIGMPGRAFPGVLLQGDSLKRLMEVVEDVEKAGRINDTVEFLESVETLKRLLNGYMRNYEDAMKAHGRKLPYIK